MPDRHTVPGGLAGTVLPPVTTEVTARRTMAYAAGIGSERAVYFAEEQPLAPPSFCVALEWALLDGVSYRERLQAAQPEMERAIHIQQSSRFHAPLRAGITVTTAARISGVRQAKTGVLVAVDLNTHDSAGTELCESRFVAMLKGAVLDGENHWSGPARDDAPEPAGCWSELMVPALAAQIYMASSGIWNPIHTEPGAAKRAGLDRPIVHGTWSWAVLAEMVIDRLADGEPTQLASWSAHFLSPVYPGEPAEVALVRDGAIVRAWLRQRGSTSVAATGTLLEIRD